MKYLLIGAILVVILGIIILFKFTRYKKPDEKIKKEVLKNLKNIKILSSYKEKLIDYDKLYHKILINLGYKGSFGEILKLNPRIINDINKVWELHKLRNKLVHDFDLVSETTLKKKSMEYEKIIINLLKKI